MESIDIQHGTCGECLQREIALTDSTPAVLVRHREPAPRDVRGRYLWDLGCMVLGNWCPGSGQFPSPGGRRQQDDGPGELVACG